MKFYFKLRVAICIISLSYTSCSLLQNNSVSSTSKSYLTKSPNYNLEKDTITEIRQEFNLGHFDITKEKTSVFLTKHPLSTFTNEALYLQALAFENNEDWDLALNNYQKIIELSLESNKEFLALALYRKANCFEAKHEPELALASLFDALHHRAYLPIEVAEAEIPARMASIYASLKQTAQADYYTIVAAKGVRKARLLKSNNEQEWLGYTLLQMGSLSLSNLTAESFYENILSFSRHQKYLLQTIEIKDNIWSPKAEDLLVKSYNYFWTTIKNFNINPSSDWEMDYVLKAEKQVEMASQLLESLEILKNYQASDELPTGAITNQVFEKLQAIENSAYLLVQKNILIKPSKKLKQQVMSGNFETVEFSDEPPKDITKKFPTKNKIKHKTRGKTK